MLNASVLRFFTGVNSLSQSLSANQMIASTLTHLDLSGNILRGDDLSYLYNFLAQPNVIQYLDLSNTECAIDTVCGALLRGGLQHLAFLNLSRTFFSHRKAKDVPPSFKQFFSSSLALTHINLSGTKLPPEPLKALLLGLACNPNLKEVSLDLSNCELRSGGAQVLEGCIAEIHNISSLDISDNGLESDLSTLVIWLSKNRSIRHLALGKNFNNMKSKNLPPVLDNLVQMIQDEDSPLQSLSLADSKLKTDVTIIINALGSNTSLTKVDISGNGMGDMGAKMLAKALQINTKLRTVIWDKNNITAQGFQDLAVALEKNYTLRYMPIPMNDASQALKTNPEKTEEALQKIENHLLRNHETRKYLQEQAYRLQQSIVTSTTQQMIDRICVKVQDHLNSLRNCGVDFVMEDVKSAERLMRDAKNSKTLLPNLYHLGGATWSGANSLPSPIQETLESMAGEVTRVVDEQLKESDLSDTETAAQLQQAQAGARPKRTVTLTQKGREKYETDIEAHRAKLELAWSTTTLGIRNVSSVGNYAQQLEQAITQLRTDYSRYQELSEAYITYLTRANTSESLQERDLQNDIDLTRDSRVRTAITDAQSVRKELLLETASQRSSTSRHSSRSARTAQSAQSNTSSASTNATKARATAEAARARAEYSRREAAVRAEKARIEEEEQNAAAANAAAAATTAAANARRKAELDADLEALNQEKEAAAAIAQAEVLEAAAQQDGGELPYRRVASEDPVQRTEDYTRPASITDTSPKKSQGPAAAAEGPELKSRPLNKDAQQRSKSSDSGEEADKEFVFI
ncbi:hypothetical protein FKM82_006344 [Ascaphus truei]